MSVPSLSRKSLYVSLAVIAVVAIVWMATSSGRNLTARFAESLRIDKPQPVNINLAKFIGPNANQSLQQMVTQMVSDQVVTTQSETPQVAANVPAASVAAGFPVRILKGRSDMPAITVLGTEAYALSVDRNRLQAIFDEAGRHDLVVPQSVNGAKVTVRIPRAVILTYGTCPGQSSAAANIATPAPVTTHYDNCLILREGPAPDIGAPRDIDLSRLSEIALELAGMTPDQAHRFLTTVNWRSLLGFSFPRFMRSYQSLTVDGVPGTLLTLGGREGPGYALFWVSIRSAVSATPAVLPHLLHPLAERNDSECGVRGGLASGAPRRTTVIDVGRVGSMKRPPSFYGTQPSHPYLVERSQNSKSSEN